MKTKIRKKCSIRPAHKPAEVPLLTPEQYAALPLSTRLEMAVEDARALALDSKHYKLNMDAWVRRDDELCVVCLAGASMVRRLGAERLSMQHVPIENICPSRFGVAEHALEEVDALRCGDGVGFSLPAKILALVRKHYNHWLHRAPWRIYLQAVRMLREAEVKELDTSTGQHRP